MVSSHSCAMCWLLSGISHWYFPGSDDAARGERQQLRGSSGRLDSALLFLSVVAQSCFTLCAAARSWDTTTLVVILQPWLIVFACLSVAFGFPIKCVLGTKPIENCLPEQEPRAHLWPNMPVTEALPLKGFCVSEVPEMLLPNRVYLPLKNKTKSTTLS